MSKFLHSNNNDDTKAIAILRVFSQNSQAKNLLFTKQQSFRAVKIESICRQKSKCYSNVLLCL